MESNVIDMNFASVIGSWVGVSNKTGHLNVYALQASSQKESLWLSIKALISSHNVTWIVFGGFNVVRFQDKRSGCRFNSGEADAFIDFIARSGLFDFPLCGRRFTRFDRDGITASKLDRFLVSHCFFDYWPDASVSVLSKSYSDHCPIMIKVGAPNFGLKPFRVFDKWLTGDGYKELIASSWASNPSLLTPGLGLKNKLKALRMDIKRWTSKPVEEQNQTREDINKNLLDWDKKAKDGMISEHDINKREEWLLDLHQLDQLWREDLKKNAD